METPPKHLRAKREGNSLGVVSWKNAAIQRNIANVAVIASFFDPKCNGCGHLWFLEVKGKDNQIPWCTWYTRDISCGTDAKINLGLHYCRVVVNWGVVGAPGQLTDAPVRTDAPVELTGSGPGQLTDVSGQLTGGGWDVPGTDHTPEVMQWSSPPPRAGGPAGCRVKVRENAKGREENARNLRKEVCEGECET